jgi:hypothetical protein
MSSKRLKLAKMMVSREINTMKNGMGIGREARLTTVAVGGGPAKV